MNPRAATFRDALNRVVGTTYAGTVCWFPRKPSQFAAVDPDGDRASILRCGWCLGCRELDRRRLAARLVKHFAEFEGNLWITVIEGERRELAHLAHKVRRASATPFEAGYLRLGSAAVGLIARGARPRPKVPASSGPRRMFSYRLKRSRGRRAWREATAGMMVSRDDYGEQTKRFYVRGLAAADKDQWTVTTKGGVGKLYAAMPVGVRAYANAVGVYAPEAWKPPKLVRRRGPESRRVARVRSEPTVAGELFGKLFESIAASAFPVNRRTAEPSASSVTGKVVRSTSGNSARASANGGEAGSVESRTLTDPPFLRSQTNSYSSVSYLSSEPTNKAYIDAWLKRMLDRSRGG